MIAWAPEKWANKDQAADIHAANVAKFIKASGVVGVINGHFAANGEAGEGKRHEGAMEESIGKTGGAFGRKRPGRGPTVKIAEDDGHDDERQQFADNQFDEGRKFSGRNFW